MKKREFLRNGSIAGSWCEHSWLVGGFSEKALESREFVSGELLPANLRIMACMIFVCASGFENLRA